MSNSDFVSEVDRVTREVIGPAAPKVDAEASFPRASIDALAKIGALGALSAKDVGGNGAGLRGAAEAVERVARDCGSTAMVYTMHLCAAAVLEKHGPTDLRKEVAPKRLVTLALSEGGSRSHFWAPVGTAKRVSNGISLDAKKSFATSAHNADYIWSSKPVEGGEASSLWFVPRTTKGINVGPDFDGLGLRGNDSTSITATDAVVPESARLGADGEGFKTMMEVVLPVFQILASSCSIGLMEGAIGRTADHVSGAKFEHMGSALRDLPTIRAYVARMRVLTDMAKALLWDTLDAVEKGRPDTMLRVLEVKAAAGETSTTVLDLAMRVCGGVAFRKEVGVERMFRDARAGTVMSPTTDLLYDFIGKAVTGLPVF